jgi:hypothetical protein
MPTLETFNKDEHVTLLLMGPGGTGKSMLAYHAPGPIAALLLDKPTPPKFPSWSTAIDPSQIYYKSYAPGDVDLTNDKHGTPRNVADAFHVDVQTIKNAIIKQTPLKIKQFDGSVEEWPLPHTLLIEGADFFTKHTEYLIMARAGKIRVEQDGDASEGFKNPLAQLWGTRLNELHQFYDQVTRLPQAHLCNVIITTGLSKETKSAKNQFGKVEIVETGKVNPDLGGKMDVQGVRMFACAYMTKIINGKHWVQTRPDNMHVGIRDNTIRPHADVQVHLDPAKPDFNPFKLLFPEVR